MENNMKHDLKKAQVKTKINDLLHSIERVNENSFMANCIVKNLSSNQLDKYKASLLIDINATLQDAYIDLKELDLELI